MKQSKDWGEVGTRETVVEQGVAGKRWFIWFSWFFGRLPLQVKEETSEKLLGMEKHWEEWQKLARKSKRWKMWWKDIQNQTLKMWG